MQNTFTKSTKKPGAAAGAMDSGSTTAQASGAAQTSGKRLEGVSAAERQAAREHEARVQRAVELEQQYDPNVDYMSEIQAAAARGDFGAAAEYEQLRNGKIAGTGDTKHVQTDLYTAYLPTDNNSAVPGSAEAADSGAARTAPNNGTDYQALINAAVERGDYVSAAKYEQLRNEKIAATGDTAHQPTNIYSAFLGGTELPGLNPDVDYQALINAALARGDYTAAAKYEQLRNLKIAVTGSEQTPTDLYRAYLIKKAQLAPLENGAPELQPLLERWQDSAMQQAETRADYAAQQGVNALRRAEEDAQRQFQAQRDQITAEEARALDNLALYNERRGDRGGIGAAQYGAVMNAAAMNRLAVGQAQTKLSTDTARQIADLRAQGEFEKADAVLELAQQYLSKLVSLRQWAAEYDLDVDKFNRLLEEWEYEFEAQAAGLTGSYQGLTTLGGRSLAIQAAGLTGLYNGNPTMASLSNLAEAGYALAAAGIQPSASQMEALRQLFGYTPEQIGDLVRAAQLGAFRGGTSGSGNGNGGVSKWEAVNAYVAIGGDADDYITANYRNLGYGNASQAKSAYRVWLQENSVSQDDTGTSPVASGSVSGGGTMTNMAR